MAPKEWNKIFAPEKLEVLFPKDRSDAFFDALFGDASEGAYDISLVFRGARQDALEFVFLLEQRPEKCLVCSLTYGLPDVFKRHPVINLKNLVAEIDGMLGDDIHCDKWELGATREISRSCHEIPFLLTLQSV